MIRRIVTCAALALLPATVLAQAPAPAASANPGTAAVKTQYGMVKGVLARTAAKVPEELYSFKATPEVRSIGQTIGHIADSQFSICSMAAGEKLTFNIAHDYEHYGNLVTYMRLNKIIPPSSEPAPAK